MPGIADDFADAYTGVAVDLARYEVTLQREILNLLIILHNELKQQIEDADILGVVRTAFQQRRQEKLIADVQASIRQVYRNLNSHTNQELTKLHAILKDGQLKALNDVVGIDIFKIRLNAQELRALTRQTNIMGAVAKDWWNTQSVNAQRRFATSIRTGVLAGETNQQLTTRVLGSRTGTRTVTLASGKKKRYATYKGGALETSRREAKTLVRNAVQSVSSEVDKQMHQENADLLNGTEALVTLDLRTTELCMSRSGAKWDSNGDPTPDSPWQFRFPGYTPWHWGCRTKILPTLKSWEDLIKEANPNFEKELRDLPNSTQSSMNGQVAGDLNYEKWLRKQPTAVQREKLGPSKYRLWKDGKISLADLTDFQGNSLTLDQLNQNLN